MWLSALPLRVERSWVSPSLVWGLLGSASCSSWSLWATMTRPPPSSSDMPPILWLDLDSELLQLLCLLVWLEEFSPRQQMLAPIWWARSKWTFLKTILAIRLSLPITSETMLVTLLAWVLIFSNPLLALLLRRWLWPMAMLSKSCSHSGLLALVSWLLCADTLSLEPRKELRKRICYLLSTRVLLRLLDLSLSSLPLSVLLFSRVAKVKDGRFSDASSLAFLPVF
mmetsp:Transcript_17076/g.47853  ORF Transcript_17076/g.47853 Transcript_17076/m.47853 type:complete len:225 (+) Transcript_17076:544-1218(+)